MGNPRQTNGHRRRQLAARVKAEETDCWLCGQPVNKLLHYLDPMAPEIDEIIPVSLGGDPLDRRNCRLSHRPDLQPTTRQRHPNATRTRRTADHHPPLVTMAG